MSHKEKIIGDTPWEALLKIEAVGETPWTKDHRSFEQLVELRRLSGLPYGQIQVRRWLRHLVAVKKIRVEEGRVKNDAGRLVRATRYIFLK